MKNEPQKAIFDAFMQKTLDAKIGHMFGYPAYYANRRLFACLYESYVGLKVPENIANEARKLEHISYFQPYGKNKMREWIQFKLNSVEDLEQNHALIQHAFEYAIGLK